MIYLCTPYTPTGDDPLDIMEWRYLAACRHAAELMRAGHVVYSPIAHSHRVADWLDKSIRLDHTFWMHQCLGILRHASEVVVVKMPGWERSVGIARECAFAHSLNIPVRYVEA